MFSMSLSAVLKIIFQKLDCTTWILILKEKYLLNIADDTILLEKTLNNLASEDRT